MTLEAEPHARRPQPQQAQGHRLLPVGSEQVEGGQLQLVGLTRVLRTDKILGLEGGFVPCAQPERGVGVDAVEEALRPTVQRRAAAPLELGGVVADLGTHVASRGPAALALVMKHLLDARVVPKVAMKPRGDVRRGVVLGPHPAAGPAVGLEGLVDACAGLGRCVLDGEQPTAL